ncbi:MAG: Na+/H+ antiporter NhaA [Gemmataceae bacterium]
MDERQETKQPERIGWPNSLAEELARPFVRFLAIESASGFLLLAATIVALALMNSQYAQDFEYFLHLPVGLTIGNWSVRETLVHVINDGLMTLFFFVVGLEIKRELVMGELRDPRKAALPIAAALGGMVVPALIYLSLQYGQPGESGWGIPMATDIAFVVGFLNLLGRRVPHSLKIMMLSLAIVDDIGAVLVIAFFYSKGVHWDYLGAAGIGFAMVLLLNRIGVRRVPVYVLVGAGIWYLFFKSGVHPTVAGVLLGLLTPASAWIGDKVLLEVLDDFAHWLRHGATREDHADMTRIGRVLFGVRECVSPLERLETVLQPWVAFGIMPVFALANAGVALHIQRVMDPVALAVVLGLVLGKPVGIVLFSWLAVKLGIARLPQRLTWPLVIGGGCLGGIGFTMSLFIANLGLDKDLLDAGKTGILTGSCLSALIGCIWLLSVGNGHRINAGAADAR